jgi:hypothetical protein
VKGGVVDPRVDIKDLEKAMKIISDADSRGRFKANPKKELKDAGVAEGDLPDELVYTLAGMSTDELAAIATLNTEMVQLGLTAEDSKVLGRAV